MTDLAATEHGKRQLNASGARFMGQSFEAIANALKAVAGPSFEMDKFIKNVGSFQINRIGATNEAGDTINDNIIVAAAAAWNDANFRIAAPSDRFRVILGLKFTLFTMTAGDDVNVGTELVPEGATQQLIARGLMRLDRSRGRQTTQKSWQFFTGADNTRFQGQPLAGGIQAIDAAIAMPRMPSESEILPWGPQQALALPIDAINPQDQTNFTLAGLGNVLVADAYVDTLAVGVDAIVLDAVMSGA